MLKNVFVSLFALIFLTSYSQQTMAEYIGEWVGQITNKQALNLNVSIEKLSGEQAVFVLSNSKEIVTKNFKFGDTISLVFNENFTFSGIVNHDRSEINGFIQNKGNLYPIILNIKEGVFEGKWNLSTIHYLQPQFLRLTIKESNIPNDEYRGYPILGGLWCNNFKKSNTAISFTDNNTGLEFEGQLKPSEIVLNINFLGNFVTKASFKKINKDKKAISIHENPKIDDGWELSKNGLVLQKMEEGIRNDSLVGIEGVLVAKSGKIIYENYFAGFNAEIPHSMRSASKSISSAIIGIAIHDKIIESVDEKMYDFIPQEYHYTKDALKSKITIKDLLTMSSG